MAASHPSSSFLALPAELYLEIADHLMSGSILNLSLTCQHLHNIVFPHIYRRLHLRCDNADDGDLEHFKELYCTTVKGLMALNKLSAQEKLRVVEFHVATCPGPFKDNRILGGSYMGRLIETALEGCWKLESVKFDFKPTPLAAISLLKIPAFTKLRRLNYTTPYRKTWEQPYSDESLERRSRDLPDVLADFTRLKSLTLTQIRGCLNKHQTNIGQFLAANPNLTELSLSVYTERYTSPSARAICHQGHRDFWKNICTSYIQHAHGRRLDLHTLHLGELVYIARATRNGPPNIDNNHMTQALDLSKLAEFKYTPLYINPSPNPAAGEPHVTSASPSAFKGIYVLNPEIATNLRRLTFSRLTEAVAPWLVDARFLLQNLESLAFEACRYFGHPKDAEDGTVTSERRAWVVLISSARFYEGHFSIVVRGQTLVKPSQPFSTADDHLEFEKWLWPACLDLNANIQTTAGLGGVWGSEYADSVGLFEKVRERRKNLDAAIKYHEQNR